MKALQCRGPAGVAIVDVPPPVPVAHEIVARVEACRHTAGARTPKQAGHLHLGQPEPRGE